MVGLDEYVDEKERVSIAGPLGGSGTTRKRSGGLTNGRIEALPEAESLSKHVSAFPRNGY
jgi:hypothetical protein